MSQRTDLSTAYRGAQDTPEQTLTIRIAEMGVVRGGGDRGGSGERSSAGERNGVERNGAERNGVERRSGVDRRGGGERGSEPRVGEERRAPADRRKGDKTAAEKARADRPADRGPSILKTTLGSCVGVILSDPVNGVHGLAHVMLPERKGADTATGKYADTAIPALVALMERTGGARRTMEAFLVGGASMFQAAEGASLPRIGEKNVETALRVLGGFGIPVVFQDTGGTAGRTVIFNCADRVPRVKTLNGVSQT